MIPGILILSLIILWHLDIDKSWFFGWYAFVAIYVLIETFGRHKDDD